MSISKEIFQKALSQIQQASLFLSKEEEALALQQVILYADEQYYIQDNPVLADGEYDQYFKQLQALEKANPTLIHPNSPTQRVAQGKSAQLNAVQHIVPMLSLENSYNEEDLYAWDKRVKEILKRENIVYSIEPKYDGAGISLVYHHNQLTVAATRGDGVVGDDITSNAKQIRTLPLYADFEKEGIEQLEVRGEVVIKKQAFQAINQQRIEEGLPPLANPRNAASGSLRLLDPEEVKKRGLFAIFYHLSFVSDFEDKNHPLHQGHFESIQWLAQKQFATPVKEMHLCQNIDEVIHWCQQYEAQRDEMPYEIDGMVIKVNSFQDQDVLGMTAHHPRWAIAFKFKARQATSQLLDVEFQVGRTGAITPVAKIEPVYIGGVTISSISLFNEDIIREKDLKINDFVLVERAGDVIPYIVKSIPERRNGQEKEIVFPNLCPVCNTSLFKPEGEVAWRCINANCAAQVVERIIHFASKDAMDIRNLGDANVKRFFELGLIKNLEDIYQLPFEQLQGLEKFGQKSIDNLKEAIEKSKTQALHRLIFALGIRFVGVATAKTLARSVHHLLELKEKNIEDLTALEDIGPKVASSIQNYFSNTENLHTLERLETLGVALAHPENIATAASGADALAGKAFLFTGTLLQLKRKEAEEWVESKGGKILSGVSSKLDFLVVGLEAGSKLDKAKKLGSVKILDEAGFMEMMAAF